MRMFAAVVACGLFAPLVLSRMLFLAPTRAGWLMYLPNVLWEYAARRVPFPRLGIEALAAVVSLVCARLSGVPLIWVFTAAMSFLVLELGMRLWERRVLSAAYTKVHFVERSTSRDTTARRGDVRFPPPSSHPELSIRLDGPFISRLPRYDLGTVRVGVPIVLEVLVGNHSLVPTQVPVIVALAVPEGWRVDGHGQQEIGVIHPGSVVRTGWHLNPTVPMAGGTVEVAIDCGLETRHLKVAFRGCAEFGVGAFRNAAIRRYPGGRRGAFSWRGDMDLYDRTTLQCIEGLEATLGLAARYRFPQTLCLSTRLALDIDAAREWAAHHGVDRGADDIPRFVEWIRTQVELVHSNPYPAESTRRFTMELGNHGHLHYDTSAASAPGNRWRSHAKVGAGVYPWQGRDRSSFGEQRDNALEARRWCESEFRFTPRTWAKPGRGNDEYSARAVEAAGCEVVSGSDIRPKDNVLLQPRPHHPHGTRAVELTSRFPSDPEHIYHLAMLVFWLHRAHRLGIPMVFMGHHHLRQFEGNACLRFTESLLRTVVRRFNGDIFVDTLFGVGKYWREVLSSESRTVQVEIVDSVLVVNNGSDVGFRDLPVEIETRDGRVFVELVDVGPNGLVKIGLVTREALERQHLE